MTEKILWTTATELHRAPEDYLGGDKVAVYCDTKPDGYNVCIFDNADSMPAMVEYLESIFSGIFVVSVVPLPEKPKHYKASFTPRAKSSLTT